MEQAFLSIGSNLGNRQHYLVAAIDGLRHFPTTEVRGSSSFIETDPWGNTDQPPFLNGIVEIATELPPGELLQHLKALEAALGRVTSYRWGPRAIDIDIITYGRWRVDWDDLIIPHRHAAERAFVLDPMREIAPDVAEAVAARRWATAVWPAGR